MDSDEPIDSSGQLRKDLSDELIRVLQLIIENPKITAREMSEKMNKTSRMIEIYIKKLKKNIIVRKGPKLGGHWEVNF